MSKWFDQKTSKTQFGSTNSDRSWLSSDSGITEPAIRRFCRFNSAEPCRKHYQRGFTILELIIVIGLLAAVSYGALAAYDGVREDALAQVAETEMAEIVKALKQYKQDMGRFPEQLHPADFTSLQIGQILDGGVYRDLEDEEKWNPDTQRGWRGPYINGQGNGYVDVGNGLSDDGTGSAAVGAVVTPRFKGVADPFEKPPVSDTWFKWYPCASCEAFSTHGRPYYLFDADDLNKARVVSAGLDGQYVAKVLGASNRCEDVYNLLTDEDDDLVMCLQ